MKIKTLLLACFLMGTTLYAQPPHEGGGHGDSKEKREKIESMKVEYITTQLNLTPTEAQGFWPVYNEFMDKIHALERERRKGMKKSAKMELSDSDVIALINKNFQTDQNILKLRMEYNAKFMKVLPTQKVGALYKAEQSFRHELLRKMKAGGPPPK